MVNVGSAADTPDELDTPGKRALYNNLGQEKELAILLDRKIKQVRPDGWRGVQPREQIIKQGLYELLGDESEVERIFIIIKAQSEY
jgi:type I restriction enzyme, R subunit